MGKFKFIDLCAGIGGMRIAFEAAGGKCVYSSEEDESNRKTYSENFVPVSPRMFSKLWCSPSEIDVRNIPDHDVLLSRLKPDKDGGYLYPFYDIIDIIRIKRPDVFLIECPIDVLYSPHKDKNMRKSISTWEQSIMGRILNEINDIYNYQMSFDLFDISFIVPQRGVKFFAYGIKKDKEMKSERVLDIKQTYREYMWKFKPSPTLPLSSIMMADVPESYNVSRSELLSLIGESGAFSCDLPKCRPNNNVSTLVPGRPPLVFQNGREALRRFTPREYARLMGFPDTFKIPVPDNIAYQQFASAVVVPVVIFIACEIRAYLEYEV